VGAANAASASKAPRADAPTIAAPPSAAAVRKLLRSTPRPFGGCGEGMVAGPYSKMRTGTCPLSRLPICANAAGVRSITWFVLQVLPQHDFAPQKLLVRGPQSAMVMQTLSPVQLCFTFIFEPQPRLGRFSPHLSGRVISQQFCDAYGQAPMYLLDLQ